MSECCEQDWDPTIPDTSRDPVGRYDDMRERCPVAFSDFAAWSVFRHEDVERVLHDTAAFSNRVSRHLSVPNGMDPPEHTAYRRLVERLLSSGRVATFEARCAAVARSCIGAVPAQGAVEIMEDVAGPFAARAQCAFLGWPESMAPSLLRWTARNHAATLARDRIAMAGIAEEFEDYVDDMIGRRRRGEIPGGDVTGELMAARVAGRPLGRDELVSVLRNWTMGEVGTLSAAVGILVHHLAADEALQALLRRDHTQVPAAVEEILRVDGPLVSNRRRTTRGVTLGGRTIPAGATVSINWIAANRDEAAFEQAHRIDLTRRQDGNLLYGGGIHVCPGAALARMELRVMLEALLEGTAWFRPDPQRLSERAGFPAAGFATLPVCVE